MQGAQKWKALRNFPYSSALSGLAQWFPMVGMVINPIVGVYINIIRIHIIRGGMSLSPTLGVDRPCPHVGCFQICQRLLLLTQKKQHTHIIPVG